MDREEISGGEDEEIVFMMAFRDGVSDVKYVKKTTKLAEKRDVYEYFLFLKIKQDKEGGKRDEGLSGMERGQIEAISFTLRQCPD